MDNRMTVQRRTYMLVGALLGWSALAIQYALLISLSLKNGVGVTTGTVRYFSYFTILTNLLVALALTLPLFGSEHTVSRFFRRAEVIAGILLYILVVGIVYGVLLRDLWAPTGWQKIVDVVLHDVMPIVFLVYWVIFVRKGALRFTRIPAWMLYPAIYFGVVLMLGRQSGVYPYPFIDVGVHGYGGVIRNAAGLMLGFVIMAALMVAVDQWVGRRRQAIPPM